MPTITLTPTACTEGSAWDDLYYYLTTNSAYYPRQLIFTFASNATLGGAGVNITGVQLRGRVRNSSSVNKQLRFGCKTGTGAAPDAWAQLSGANVLDSAFVAAPPANRTGSYTEYAVSRTVTGTALELFAGHIKGKFAAGDAVYIGVIQPQDGRSIQVRPALSEWTMVVTYELLGNVPTANASAATLGSTAITTTVQKVISGSSTTLRYKIGSNTISTANIGTGTSHTYTVPTSAGQYFPSAQTATLTIETETFVGGTSYGTVSTSVTLKLPSDAAPTAMCSPSRTWVSGVADSAKIAAYVQQKSGVSFALSGTAKYGASIASFKVVFNGQTKTRSGNGSISFSPITGSGTLTYTYAVTDSRGLSRSASGTVSVLKWGAPRISMFAVERATADNTLAIDGTYARATVQASADSLPVGGVQHNGTSYHVQYRQAGTETWTDCDAVDTGAISVNQSALLADGGAAVGTFNDLEGYEFRLVLSDIYATVNAMDEMPTKETFWDINQANGAMGFGGEAPQGDGPAYKFYGPVEAEGIRGVNIYNAGEEATGGTWIDGKPVYRVCGKYTGAITLGGNTDIDLGISSIDTVIRADVFSKSVSGSDHSWFALTYYNGNAYSMSYLINNCATSPKLRLVTATDMNTSGQEVVYAIEYTKS